MITFTVHEQPDAPADRLDRATGLEFIRDGFSIVAAVLGPIWMLSNRIWLGVLGYAAALGLLSAVLGLFGGDFRWFGLLVAVLHLLIGFEASSLRRWALERGGWHMLGTVAGRNAEDCERRFFNEWLTGQPFLSGARMDRPAAGMSDRVSASMSGLRVRLGARLRALFRRA